MANTPRAAIHRARVPEREQDQASLRDGARGASGGLADVGVPVGHCTPVPVKEEPSMNCRRRRKNRMMMGTVASTDPASTRSYWTW